MITIGELAIILDQNMINYEKRRDILFCIFSNIGPNLSFELVGNSLETLKNFVIFLQDALKEKVFFNLNLNF